jgi:uncharacterized peroxidase-related enzyme
MIRLTGLKKDGKSLKHRLIMQASKLFMRMEVPDILYVIWHRPKFFGRASGKLHQAVLRGPSDWSVGEREIFAAWVSIKNQCRFCADAHTSNANTALNKKIANSLDGPLRLDELSDKARLMLPFLEKLTLTPELMNTADLAPLRAAGISTQAIADAVHVVAIFSFMNRIADATGCHALTPKQADFATKIMLDKGYEE